MYWKISFFKSNWVCVYKLFLYFHCWLQSTNKTMNKCLAFSHNFKLLCVQFSIFTLHPVFENITTHLAYIFTLLKSIPIPLILHTIHMYSLGQISSFDILVNHSWNILFLSLKTSVWSLQHTKSIIHSIWRLQLILETEKWFTQVEL